MRPRPTPQQLVQTAPCPGAQSNPDRWDSTGPSPGPGCSPSMNVRPQPGGPGLENPSSQGVQACVPHTPEGKNPDKSSRPAPCSRPAKCRRCSTIGLAWSRLLAGAPPPPWTNTLLALLAITRKNWHVR